MGGEGDEGRIVRNAMVEALWIDCDNRAKALGDMSSSTRSKHIASVAEEFQASLFIYDEGLLGNDLQLANALWRRFFLSMYELEDGSKDAYSVRSACESRTSLRSVASLT